ncbi:outer membrane beta-barrel protein [Haloflavibacter putidus]|uniref:Outer membrane beta-barrel protein n=1 Tax=Haloflavibacter putidus TaxID=2576776 RepID=A0A507ZGN0_9FLAO|nr:outer membrane beta-barrel protein [Haloflavibacter putidus]TQD36309.1 outer membrane beta-barrel protein [Haloflavibacter putidus]
MKKLLLIAVFATFSFATMQAQEGFKLGIHAGLPMGDIDDFTTVNLGLDAAYHWNVAESFDVGIATGYTVFLGEDFDTPLGTVEAEDLSYIPIAASARYAFSENWFGGVDLGYALSTDDEVSDSGFYYQPKVGYMTMNFDIFAFYKGISLDGASAGALGIGAAYKF